MFCKLKIDFNIPDDLSDIIDEYIDYLNNGGGTSDDYFKTEIKLTLNWCLRENKLSDDQIKLLRDYYQNGGIVEI